MSLRYYWLSESPFVNIENHSTAYHSSITFFGHTPSMPFSVGKSFVHGDEIKERIPCYETVSLIVLLRSRVCYSQLYISVSA